jgi:nucleotide-binding universal stress UspA family protein
MRGNSGRRGEGVIPYPLRPPTGYPIIVGVKLGQDPRVAAFAAELAKATGSPLVCAHVDASTYLIEWESPSAVGPMSLDPAGPDADSETMVRALRSMLDRELGTYGISWSFRLLGGEPAAALGRLAVSCGASLLVVGSNRSTAWARSAELVSGSVVQRLIRVQPCPVVVVPHALARVR